MTVDIMYNKVPELSIVFMVFAALMGIAIPTVMCILLRKKKKADIASFFIGCAVFAVFALGLEGIANRLILGSAAGKVIQEDVWLFAVFGGLMAGVFEETGRFAAFKTVLKKKQGRDANALMYGAGHGGIEAFYILTIGMVSNIALALTVNAGMAGTLTAGVKDPAVQQQLNAALTALSGTAPPVFLAGVVERLAAVTLQISLSVLVWFAAMNANRFLLYPLAVLLHAVIDAVAVILSRSGVNIWILEGIVYVFTAGCVILAVAVWKKNAAVPGVSGEEVPGHGPEASNPH